MNLWNGYKNILKLESNIQEIKWWKITRYEIDLVLRDKEWWLGVVPKVMSFYDHLCLL